MAWLAKDKDGTEVIFDDKPIRGTNAYECNIGMWFMKSLSDNYIILPEGSIEKLTGKVITWEDEPIELK